MKNKIKLSPFVGSLFTATVAMLCTITCPATSLDALPTNTPWQKRAIQDPQAAQPAPAPTTLPQPAVLKADAVNYSVRVQWKDAKGATNSFQIAIAEGDFKMDAFQSQSVRINKSDVPVMVTLSGRLTVLSPEKGQLYLALGKKIPVVVNTTERGTNSPISSYQYCDFGLKSTVVVTFGKPMLIQADENGEVSLLVQREDN